MGFPRILSKNNKIYTKLGEFVLSPDGNLWIVCHVCQEEHVTQDQFWKHIQDEHNFLHGLKQEHHQQHHQRHHSASGSSLMEAAEAATAALLPLPLYRKVENVAAADVHDHNNSQSGSGEQDGSDAEPKDYTEMRSLDASSVEIDIKVEPPSVSQPPLSQSVADIVSISAPVPPALYHLGVQNAGAAGYPSMVMLHTPSSGGGLLSHDIAAVAAAAAAAGGGGGVKEESRNSTTASASSAVSSDDGERWYICDHETCGLKFKYQSRLELHRSVHSKERRFACELCGASFKQSCNLSTHRKKKHFLKGSKGVLLHQTF